MLGGYKTDIGKLAYVGKQGVLCLLSESLYADKKGYTSPQHRISESFREILGKYEGRILFNIYDSQLYRIQELLTEIEKSNRKVIIMGKTLEVLITNCIERGYINFDLDEAKIVQDENGKAIDVTRRVREDGECLIEDFMIIANECVATHIYFMNLPFVYRVHGTPKEEKVNEFIDLL